MMPGQGYGFHVKAFSGGGGSAEWTPEDLTGSEIPKIWVRPDDIAEADGVTIAQWDDQSGNGNHLISSAVPCKESAIDGWKSANFLGLSEAFAVTNSPTVTGSFEVWAVYRAEGGGYLTEGLRNFSDDWFVNGQQASTPDQFPDNTTAYRLMRVTRSNLNNQLQSYKEGDTRVSTGNVNTAAVGLSRVGKDLGSNYWAGELVELLAFDVELTNGSIWNMLGYLEDKYPTVNISFSQRSWPELEDIGTLDFALDGKGRNVISGSDCLAIWNNADGQIPGQYDCNGREAYNAADANFNSRPSFFRQSAGEFFDRQTGTLMSHNESTMAIVVLPTLLGSQCMPMDRIAGGSGSAFSINTNGAPRMEPGAGTFYDLAPAGSLVAGSGPYVVIGTYSALTNQIQGWLDGVKQSAPAGTPSGTMVLDRFGSSLSSNGDFYWAGLYIYDGILDDAAVNTLGSTLATYYGTTW